MVLRELLRNRRTSILDRWFELILETYPEDTSLFLKKEKDRFLNPVGSTTYEGISEIFDGLCQGINLEKLINPIDNILRIRAVQDFSPSQAVIFIFMLKRAIKEACGNDLSGYADDLFQIDSEIDELALQVFDNYTDCREKINEIKIKEIKTQREQAFRMLQRMGLS